MIIDKDKLRIVCRYTLNKNPISGNIIYVLEKKIYFLKIIPYWKKLRVFWERKSAESFLKSLL